MVEIPQIESQGYFSIVDIPGIYKRRTRFDKRKMKYILRKSAAVPFAVLYGIFLYLMLRYLIFPVLHEGLPTKVNATNNIDFPLKESNSKIIQINRPVSNISKLFSIHNLRKHQTTYHSGKNEAIIGYISSAFTLSIGISSIFSRGARCFTLLILPCAMAGTSRKILFTFIIGLLADGPFDSLVYNFNEISINPRCMYEAVRKMAKSSIMKLNSLHRIIRELKKLFENAFGASDEIFDGKTNLKKDFTLPRTYAIKSQMSMLKSGIYNFRKFIELVTKFLTSFSILLVIIDSMTYLRSYYSDNTFDNMYINKQVRKVWKQKGFEMLIPLRNWEVNEGYKVFTSSKFTKRELNVSFHNILPTILFTLFANLVMVSDYLVANMLETVEYKEKINISFAGVDKTFENVGKLIIEKFNNATASCVSHPRSTSVSLYALVYFLLIVAAISCIFETHLSRIRTRICNIFYNTRAEERAIYLHYRIHAGRINRKTQLKPTIVREIERRKRLQDFSPWSTVKTFRRWRLRRRQNIACPGCGWQVKYYNAKDVCLILDKSVTNGKICGNCYLDF